MRAICFEDLSSGAVDESMYKARGGELDKTHRSLAAAWLGIWLIEFATRRVACATAQRGSGLFKAAGRPVCTE